MTAPQPLGEPVNGHSNVASRAYLALGSNLGDRVAHLVAAREAIGLLPSCVLRQSSSLYETEAWGVSEPQPDYLNAVVVVETTLAPLDLWKHTSAIEKAQGRLPGATRNAARTLDIDVLLFGDIALNTSYLVIPHPRMHLRKFVLRPLLEIEPMIKIPGRGSANDLLQQLDGDDARKLSHNSAWN